MLVTAVWKRLLAAQPLFITLLLSGTAQGKSSHVSVPKQHRVSCINSVKTAGSIRDLFKSPQDPSTDHIQPNFNLSSEIVQAQNFIENIKKEPACKQSALAYHGKFCHTFDGRNSAVGTEAALLKSENIFGIRMTHCALEEASQSLPMACQPILGERTEDRVSEQDIKVCLESIYNYKVNAWTTYEHAKKNGLIICQGMRAYRDREEQLHFFKILQDLYGDIGEVTRQHGLDLDEVRESFKDFKSSVGRWHEEFLDEHAVFRSELRKSFSEVKADVDSSRDALAEFAENVMLTQRHLQAESKQWHAALSRVTDLSKDVSVNFNIELAKVFEELDEKRNELLFRQQQALDSIFQRFFAFTNSVELANDLTSKMASRLDFLDTGLEGSLGKVGNLGIALEEQLRQQSRVQGRLNEAEAAANRTLESVEATTEQVGGLANAFAFLGGISKFPSAFGMYLVWAFASSSLIAACLWSAGWPIVPIGLTSLPVGIGKHRAHLPITDQC